MHFLSPRVGSALFYYTGDIFCTTGRLHWHFIYPKNRFFCQIVLIFTVIHAEISFFHAGEKAGFGCFAVEGSLINLLNLELSTGKDKRVIAF
jgi:hypothetical protein